MKIKFKLGCLPSGGAELETDLMFTPSIGMNIDIDGLPSFTSLKVKDVRWTFGSNTIYAYLEIYSDSLSFDHDKNEEFIDVLKVLQQKEGWVVNLPR